MSSQDVSIKEQPSNSSPSDGYSLLGDCLICPETPTGKLILPEQLVPGQNMSLSSTLVLYKQDDQTYLVMPCKSGDRPLSSNLSAKMCFEKTEKLRNCSKIPVKNDGSKTSSSNNLAVQSPERKLFYTVHTAEHAETLADSMKTNMLPLGNIVKNLQSPQESQLKYISESCTVKQDKSSPGEQDMSFLDQDLKFRQLQIEGGMSAYPILTTDVMTKCGCQNRINMKEWVCSQESSQIKAMQSSEKESRNLELSQSSVLLSLLKDMASNKKSKKVSDKKVSGHLSNYSKINPRSKFAENVFTTDNLNCDRAGSSVFTSDSRKCDVSESPNCSEIKSANDSGLNSVSEKCLASLKLTKKLFHQSWQKARSIKMQECLPGPVNLKYVKTIQVLPSIVKVNEADMVLKLIEIHLTAGTDPQLFPSILSPDIPVLIKYNDDNRIVSIVVDSLMPGLYSIDIIDMNFSYDNADLALGFLNVCSLSKPSLIEHAVIAIGNLDAPFLSPSYIDFNNCLTTSHDNVLFVLLGLIHSCNAQSDSYQILWTKEAYSVFWRIFFQNEYNAQMHKGCSKDNALIKGMKLSKRANDYKKKNAKFPCLTPHGSIIAPTKIHSQDMAVRVEKRLHTNSDSEIINMQAVASSEASERGKVSSRSSMSKTSSSAFKRRK